MRSGSPRRRLGRLSRRARTLWTGGVLGAALLVLATAVPVPFVALGPGTTYNTIATVDGHDVISFVGEEVPEVTAEQPAGALDMLTIRVVDQIPLIEAVAMWASGGYQMAPREEYYPSDVPKSQVKEENVQRFLESQSAAEIQALTYLDYPTVVYVGTLTHESPSWELLRPRDRIIAVDGSEVTDYRSLAAVMATTTPGQTVAVTVERDGEEVTESITLQARPEVGPQGFLGIQVVERPWAPFEIHIGLEDIGGPSAGLMFTLGIIDRLTEGDLTGGKRVAGTGTVDLTDDRVGPIGGVTFKAVAAQRAGAQYMLVPAENCAEALTDPPAGLTLVRVGTVPEAVAAVEAIAADEPVTTC